MTQKPMLRGEVDCARLHKKGENGRRGVVGGGVGHFVGKRQKKDAGGKLSRDGSAQEELGSSILTSAKSHTVSESLSAC